MLSVIADWAGIVSLALTVTLLIRSEALRKEIESQRQDYIKEQRSIKNLLISLRSNLIDDDLLNLKIVSDIRTQLFTYQQKFKRLLSYDDKSHIKATLALLDNYPDGVDPNLLCRELDYFVARFERKEKK